MAKCAFCENEFLKLRTDGFCSVMCARRAKEHNKGKNAVSIHSSVGTLGQEVRPVRFNLDEILFD